MSYSTHNFVQGDLLNAIQLNEMDNKLLDLDTRLRQLISGTLPDTPGQGGGSGMGDFITTPDEYGAVGDGIHDDGPALQAALKSGKSVHLNKDLYVYSQIRVANTNVYVDGEGHTVYVDMQNYDGTKVADHTAIIITSDYVDDPSAPVAHVRDSEVMLMDHDGVLPGTAVYHNDYRRGYIRYKGINPTPTAEVYDNPIIKYWNEYHAIVKNINFRCKNFEAFTCLELRRMCHSVVDHVSTIIEPGHDGATGINIQLVHDCKITNCFSSDWHAKNTASFSSEGYGISLCGDGIVMENCVFYNCKHDVAAGANRQLFDTGMIMNNIVCYRKYDRSVRDDGSAMFMQQFDIHAACHAPIVNNLYLICDTNEQGAWMMSIRCPQATLTNVNIMCEPGGLITCSELCDEITFNNLKAPNTYLRTRASSPFFLKNFTINNGELRRITNSNIANVVLNNVTVHEIIDETSNLYMNNCRVLKELDWPGKSTVTAEHEIVMNGCTIYGTRTEYCDSKVPIVKSGEKGGIRIVGTKFFKHNDKETFVDKIVDEGQPELLACWEEDIRGIHLGLESSSLDEYNLF